MLAFFDGEVELLLQGHEGGLPVGVFVELEFRLVHGFAHLGILQVTQKGFIARLSQLKFEQSATRLRGLACIRELSGLSRQTVAKHILLTHELLDEGLEAVVLMGGYRRGPTNDERRAGLVDEDRIHFIHDGEIVSALDLLLATAGHAVVTKVIEAELTIGSVGDIALVLGAAKFGMLVIFNDTNREAEKLVEMTHPLSVAAGEVIVDRDHVNPASCQGIEINGQCANKRLPFASGHFRNMTTMENHASNQLHVEVDHIPRERVIADDEFASIQATRPVFHHSESFWQNGVHLRGQHLWILDLR